MRFSSFGLNLLEARRVEKDTYYIYIGPQHPGSGHMRLKVRLDGDVIVSVDPDVGYVHRGVEKLAETREWIKNIPLFERVNIIDACNVTLPYVRAIEALAGLAPTYKASVLRTALCEINRISSHLYGIGILGVFIGHSTTYMWCFADREVFVKLAEELTGSRLTHTYNIPGGVRRDAPADFPELLRKVSKYMRRRLDDYKKFILNNPVVRNRMEGVGVISKSKAVELGITGPNLRGSGVAYDVRLAEPYEVYAELSFEIPVAIEGDALARTYVRLAEIEQSLYILEQLASILEKLRNESVLSKDVLARLPKSYREAYEQRGIVKLLPTTISMKVPSGRAVSRGESGRGEIFYYVESKGGEKPYRVRLVTPSFRNLIAFKYVAPGHRLMDLPTIYGSLDYFPPEADR
ncbi:MAG: NADH-quinone oxidoreductase subunit D [Acidilobaceae archaeon]